jgi:hypothetical protein
MWYKDENRWMFVGDCETDSGTYPVGIDRFFHNPSATVDWMAHLTEKRWMNWKDFMEMMRRFRRETDSFHCIK